MAGDRDEVVASSWHLCGKKVGTAIKSVELNDKEPSGCMPRTTEEGGQWQVLGI
jgi:hypothetical protein